MATSINYPDNTFHNEDGNVFVNTSIAADSVVLDGTYSAGLFDIEFHQQQSVFHASTLVQPAAGRSQRRIKSLTDELLIGPSNEEQAERLLAKLPYAAEATMHHYSRQGEALCMADTCTQVLHDIMA
jgi:hypothetical protein